MTNIRKTGLAAVLTAVLALGGAAPGGYGAEMDMAPGLKCQGCNTLGCPDVGALLCFRGEITVKAGPFGEVTGEVVCYQSEAGSEGPSCSDGGGGPD